MDIFAEQLVTRKRQAKDFLVILAILVLAIILSLICTIFFGVLSFVPLCGVWFGAGWLITRTNTEYEYIITSAVLDIDKIMAKRSRKRMVSIDLKNAERFMPIDDMPKRNAKINDATPNGIEEGVYGIDFLSNGELKRLIFKPDKRILNSAKLASPEIVTLRQEDVGE